MDVVACGVPVMDVIVNTQDRIGANMGCDVTAMSWQYGGKVATGIVAAARLSERTCAMMGTVGGQTGQLIKRDFVRHGVDVSRLFEVENGESALCLVMAIASDQSRNFYTRRQTIAPIAPEQVDEAMIAGAKYLLLSDPRAYSLHAARLARRHGVKVVYDADRYYDEGMETMLREVDYLIPSEFCFLRMFEDKDIKSHLHDLRGLAAPGAVVIVTIGERGLLGLDGDGVFELPAFEVNAVDTTGAGDVFHGAFIAGLLRGMDVRESCRYASAAAAIKCTRIGGRAGIPTHDVVMRYLREGIIDYTQIDESVAYYANMPTL
jgi:sugar/nucleoside kinase (ribokinase family)